MRYKNEKMFYTNFGALSSILLILTMIGLFLSYLLTMLSKTSITSSITTTLSENKEQDLIDWGGLFLFGYRIIDENGDVFDDESYLKATFSTVVHEWDEELNDYSDVETQYYQGPCGDVFTEDILGDDRSASTSFNTE